MWLFRNLFNETKKVNNDPVAEAFEVAVIEFEKGEYREAWKHFAVLAKAAPDHALANLMLARTMMEVGEYTDAVGVLLTHLEYWPESLEARILLGMAHYETGHVELAEDRFKEALELKKDSILVHENLAITHIHEDRYEEAKEELVKLLEERPDDQEILSLLILVYGKLGDLKSATALFSDRARKQKSAERCQ